MTATAPHKPLGRLRQLRQDLAGELFERDGLNTLFAHARNILTAALIITAGTYAIHHVTPVQAPGMFAVHLAGYVVAAMGVLLLLLNLADGLRRLARRSNHLALRAAAILFYLLLTVRTTQVAIYFRSAS